MSGKIVTSTGMGHSQLKRSKIKMGKMIMEFTKFMGITLYMVMASCYI